MHNFENVEAKVQEIKDREELGDRVIHDITRALHKTFVTPIDREDILELAGRLDDVVDAIGRGEIAEAAIAEPERTLLQFVKQLTNESYRNTQAEVQKVRAAGDSLEKGA